MIDLSLIHTGQKVKVRNFGIGYVAQTDFLGKNNPVGHAAVNVSRNIGGGDATWIALEDIIRTYENEPDKLNVVDGDVQNWANRPMQMNEDKKIEIENEIKQLKHSNKVFKRRYSSGPLSSELRDYRKTANFYQKIQDFKYRKEKIKKLTQELKSLKEFGFREPSHYLDFFQLTDYSKAENYAKKHLRMGVNREIVKNKVMFLFKYSESISNKIIRKAESSLTEEKTSLSNIITNIED